MPEPTFAQPERRSFLVPVLLALAAIAVAVAIAVKFFPATTVNIEHIHTDVLPTQTVFKGSSIVGLNETFRDFFVASKIRIDNQLRGPIYLDQVHLTFINSANEEVTVEAAAKRDLPDLQTNFPALKPLLVTLLPRDAAIDPGKSAMGTVLFSLPILQSDWDSRKSAVIKVDVYHRTPIYVTIPKVTVLTTN